MLSSSVYSYIGSIQTVGRLVESSKVIRWTAVSFVQEWSGRQEGGSTAESRSLIEVKELSGALANRVEENVWGGSQPRRAGADELSVLEE